MASTHLLRIGTSEVQCQFEYRNMWPLSFQLPEELLSQVTGEHSKSSLRGASL